MRALAVTGGDAGLLPELPTIGNFVPGWPSGSFGFGAPRTTPAEIVDKLSREINAVLADPKAKARIAELGGEPLARPACAAAGCWPKKPKSGARWCAPPASRWSRPPGRGRTENPWAGALDHPRLAPARGPVEAFAAAGDPGRTSAPSACRCAPGLQKSAYVEAICWRDLGMSGLRRGMKCEYRDGRVPTCSPSSRDCSLAGAGIRAAPFRSGGRAQTPEAGFPNKPVRLIVPVAAGFRRISSRACSPSFQQYGVSRFSLRTGAGTNIGNEYATRSDPDGYTVLFAASLRSTPASLAELRSDCGCRRRAYAPAPISNFVPNSSPPIRSRS